MNVKFSKFLLFCVAIIVGLLVRMFALIEGYSEDTAAILAVQVVTTMFILYRIKV